MGEPIRVPAGESKTRSGIFKHKKGLRDKETAIHFFPSTVIGICLFSASLQNKVETKAVRGLGRTQQATETARFY